VPEWLDKEAEFGKPYTYVVQRTEAAGAAVAESELSEPVTITPRDTFPPATPTGIRAIGGTQSIELTWERNTEADLAGYRLYRAAGDGAFEKLEDLVQVPAYSDRKVETGKTYRYQISAVDQAGNESPRSAAIAVRVD
jgi:fibronectin type 3 domain-containing protein